ncbi:hypothetical protein Tco_1423816, partial [Tanacetum coccineum]
MNSGERCIDGKDWRTAGGRSELSVGTEHHRIDIDGKVSTVKGSEEAYVGVGRDGT